MEVLFTPINFTQYLDSSLEISELEKISSLLDDTIEQVKDQDDSNLTLSKLLSLQFELSNILAGIELIDGV